MSRVEIEEALAEDFALSNLTKNANQVSMSRSMPRPLINLSEGQKNLAVGSVAFGGISYGVKEATGSIKNIAEAYKDVTNPEEVNINTQLPEMPRKLGVTSLTPTPYNNVNKSTMPVKISETAAAIGPTITSGNTTLPTAPVQNVSADYSQLPNY